MLEYVETRTHGAEMSELKRIDILNDIMCDVGGLSAMAQAMAENDALATSENLSIISQMLSLIRSAMSAVITSELNGVQRERGSE